jgi:hypothetical protein
MAKIEANIIEWNKAPLTSSSKVTKEHRLAFCDRFDVAVFNLRDENEYNKLLLKDGWVIKSETDVSFVVNPIKDEDLSDNANLAERKLDSGKLGAKLRKIRDNFWDCKTYGDFSKVEGLTVDTTIGKITCKVI